MCEFGMSLGCPWDVLGMSIGCHWEENGRGSDAIEMLLEFQGGIYLVGNGMCLGCDEDVIMM